MENRTISMSSSDHLDKASWKPLVLTFTVSVIIMIALLGNLVVIVVFSTYKPLQKISNSFIVSLAVADILVATVNMPAWIIKIIWDCTYSKTNVWICLDIAVGVASILNLTAISVCRYVHVTNPYKYTKVISKYRVLSSIVGIWLVAITIALLKGMIPKNTGMWYYQPGYQLLVFLMFFILPLTGMSYCYFHVFKEVSRHQRRIPRVQLLPEKVSSPIDVKAIKTIAVVVLMFVICWCPFFVAVLVNGFCKCVTNIYLISFVKILHYSSSTLNPIIYVWYNKEYRKAFITALNKFANHHRVEFLVAFLNNSKDITGEGIDEKTGKIILLRS